MTSEPHVWKLPPLPPPTLAEIRHQWRKASPRYLKEAKAGVPDDVPDDVTVPCRGALRAQLRRIAATSNRWVIANKVSKPFRLKIALRLEAERAKLGGRRAA